MTVSTTLNKIILVGDGVTTAFSFPFAVRSGGQADIQVFLTTAAGVITQLTYATQYSVTLNAAIAPNPTPVGGSVTCSVAPAAGTLVTILRTMALTQPTSLANQGNLYQPVLESTDDNQEMQVQQLSELLSRMISVAVSDSAPLNLPPAAQRANLAFMFDSAGNPIAAAPGGANSPVSSAMAPVVNAASIAAAVALLGLTGAAPLPTGMVAAFAGAAPSGWLLAAGQAVSRTGATTVLFAYCGTQFGVGDGSTTFNLPDLRGRVPAGLDNMNGVAALRLTGASITSGGGPTTLGGNGGAEQNTIASNQMPSHTHAFTGAPLGTHTHGPSAGSQFISDSGGGQFGASGGSIGTNAMTAVSAGTPAGTNAATGGSTPLLNVQPTICLNYCIKT